MAKGKGKGKDKKGKVRPRFLFALMGIARLRAGHCGSRRERARVRHGCVHGLFADAFAPPLAGFAQTAKLGLPLGRPPWLQQAVCVCLQPTHGRELRLFAEPRSLHDHGGWPPSLRVPKKPWELMGVGAYGAEGKGWGWRGGRGCGGGVH
jgi:hypothetical protein